MIICPKCGWENKDEYNFCLGCGSPLPQTSDPPESTPPVEVPPSEAEDDVKGNQEEAEDLLADSDAPAPSEAPGESSPPMPLDYPQEELVDIVTCPDCDAPIIVNDLFCGQCGAKVVTHEEMEDPPSLDSPPTQASQDSFHARLILLLPNGQEGGNYPLKADKTVIGRKQGNILFLDDPFVSPIHATFVTNASKALEIHDNSSLNGIFLRLRQSKEIFHKDVLLVGKQLLRLELLPAFSVAEKLARFNPEKEFDALLLGSPRGPYWGKLTQLIANHRTGNSVLLGGDSIEMGRERGHITFPGDRFTSAIHAKIFKQGERIWLEDLGSRNGTFTRIREEYIIKNNDVLIIGEQLMRITIDV